MDVFKIKNVNDLPINIWIPTRAGNKWCVYIKKYNGHYMVKTKPSVRITPLENEILALKDEEINHIYDNSDNFLLIKCTLMTNILKFNRK